VATLVARNLKKDALVAPMVWIWQSLHSLGIWRQALEFVLLRLAALVAMKMFLYLCYVVCKEIL
jgi:hypothetical protein